jgi:hypothetical protein
MAEAVNKSVGRIRLYACHYIELAYVHILSHRKKVLYHVLWLLRAKHNKAASISIDIAFGKPHGACLKITLAK